MAFFRQSTSRPAATYVAPWAILGSAVILAMAVTAMAAFNVYRERQVTSRILSDKGAALISAFEAGVRTGMRGPAGAGLRLQTLMDETASHHDILFIVVADASGRVLARDQVGRASMTRDQITVLDPMEDVQWTLLHLEDGREAFVVYADFLVLHDDGQEGSGRMQGMHRRRNEFICPEGCDAEGNPIDDVSAMHLAIYLGMDVAPYALARAQDIRHTLLTALIMFCLGFAAVASMFWMHNYRASRRELLDTRALASEVVTNLPEGLIVLDSQGRVTFVNSAAQSLLPKDAGNFQGHDMRDLLPPELTTLLDRDKQALPVLDREMDCSLAGSDPLPLSVSVSSIITEEDEAVGHLVILRDLRRLRQLEREVRRREKLAALGDLAAGVAHEIRNPLSTIRGYAAMFAGRFAEGSEERQSAQLMATEADRLNKAVSNLLEFARTSEIKAAPRTLSEIAEHTLRLVRQDAEQNHVAIRAEHDPDQPLALVDGDRFTQVLLNVFLNAIQAMVPNKAADAAEDAAKGGVMRVRTLGQGNKAVVEVSDTGKGMQPSEVRRVFDPYFSTKPSGTGLGMAIVHSIVEAHGGEVRIQSKPGRGTTVAITLPTAPQGDVS